jgi:hypothetical protein
MCFLTGRSPATIGTLDLSTQTSALSQNQFYRKGREGRKGNVGKWKEKMQGIQNQNLQFFLPNLYFAFFASVAVKGVASETGLAEC